jgi:hypothetical protein
LFNAFCPFKEIWLTGKLSISLYKILFSFLALYYGVSICLVSFASAMAVVTLNIHYRGLRGAEVPLKIKTIFLGFLARIVFVQSKADRKAEKNFHVGSFFIILIFYRNSSSICDF